MLSIHPPIVGSRNLKDYKWSFVPMSHISPVRKITLVSFYKIVVSELCVCVCVCVCTIGSVHAWRNVILVYFVPDIVTKPKMLLGLIVFV
jgi:hypothetical protein